MEPMWTDHRPRPPDHSVGHVARSSGLSLQHVIEGAKHRTHHLGRWVAIYRRVDIKILSKHIFQHDP